MISVLGENYFYVTVFAKKVFQLFQRVINILFEILIYRRIIAIDTRDKFIQYDQLIFRNRIHDLMCILTSIQEMRNKDIMRIIVFTFFDQAFENGEVIIVNIEIDRSHFM